jgi:hypothetical protein
MYSKRNLDAMLRQRAGDVFPICADVVLVEWLNIAEEKVSYILSIYHESDDAPECEVDGGATWLSLYGYAWLLNRLKPRNYQAMLRDLSVHI